MSESKQKMKPGARRAERVSLDPECAKILRDMMEKEGFRTKSGAARVLIVRGKRAYDEDKIDGF